MIGTENIKKVRLVGNNTIHFSLGSHSYIAERALNGWKVIINIYTRKEHVLTHEANEANKRFWQELVEIEKREKLAFR